MSIIIRLQNLPWSANSVDIRRFFNGLSIPEGGVHIVGGEMGDAFIAFSTDEDARLAMAKDGGKIKDMQIKLLLSSRTEMMRVIEQARQQNIVVTAQPQMMMQTPMMANPLAQMMQTPMTQMMPIQQQTRSMPSAVEPDRRRGRSPTTRHRSRERSPARDRRRSPDDRRSKRDRSRSPSRSSRSFSRDDRRGDDRRYKRDDRRYDDSRYRDDRGSSRDESDAKKHLDADRSQHVSNEGMRDMQHVYDAVQNIAMSGLFQYGNPQISNAAVKAVHSSYLGSSADTNHGGSMKPNEQQSLYMANQALFQSSPFGEPKNNSSLEQGKPRRRSRFEPENAQQTSAELQNQSSAYSINRTSGTFSNSKNAWGQGGGNSSSNSITPNGDLVQVVPMDLDPPENDTLIETVAPNTSYSYGRSGDGSLVKNQMSVSSMSQNDSQNRNSPMRNDQRIRHDEGPNRMKSNEMNNNNRSSPMLSSMDMYSLRSHGDNQTRVPSSLTVEVKGLPPDASITDILDLFRGISLPAANIRIEASERGFEKAYIRFTSATDFEEALNRNRRFMNEGRCELVPCPASAFEGARLQKSNKPRPKPREDDLIVQLRGLPFTCKEHDVVQFFDGLTILDLFIQYAPEGRATGIGYVEFGSHKDFRSALIMNGKMIGHRYITVSVGSKEMLSVARGEDYDIEISQRDGPPRDDSKGPHHPPLGPRPPLLQGNQVRPAGPINRHPPSCIFLKNLPEDVTDRHIADFLGQAHIRPRAIHIMLRPDTQIPSGEAYAEFTNPANMEAALKLGGKQIAGKPVHMSPISYFAMSEILGRPTAFPEPSDGGLLRTPMDRPRGPLLPQGPRERPRMDFPPRGAMRPRMDGPPGRPPFGPPGRMRGPWPNRPRLDSRFPPPVDRGPKDFGSPGCVVSITNLHFRAGLEELLEFFKGYNITKDSIIRKYNEHGQTTGEARVAFQTPQDAQKVVRELNQKTIMGRSLNLYVL